MAKDKLTAIQVEKSKKLKTPGCYNDGGGLYLDVRPNGNRSWLFRFKMGGAVQSRWMGLGSLETVSLAEARNRAREARQVILDGRDPIEARKGAFAAAKAERLRTVTFAEAVGQFLATAK